MKKTSSVSFTPIPLDAVWTITNIWTMEGPLVLVEVHSTQGEVHRSRFDVGKEIFFDPLPVRPSVAVCHRLAQAVHHLTRLWIQKNERTS